MARNSNPAATVLRFFQTADLSVAETVLALARAEVAKRRPAKRKATLKPIKKTVPLAPPPYQGEYPDEPVSQAPPPPTKLPRVRKPKDVPLPGVVSEVG